MEKEFNLSEKMYYVKYDMKDINKYHCIRVKDVEEFIKLLKEETKREPTEDPMVPYKSFWLTIDKLAGDKLS